MENSFDENILSSIKRNKYDLEAWNILIRECQKRKIEDARPIYQQLISTFPTSGRFWKIYIEQEMKALNYEKVENLFQQSLNKVLNIDLWKMYLTYLKENKSSLPRFNEKMAQAYDFTLEKIGLDFNSYSIWNEYITFLKGVDACGSYAENQKTILIRKVYHKGVKNPMINIEHFWKDYLDYEQSTNSMIAEKMAIEHSKEYMNSRRVSKEYEIITRGLNRNFPSIPPSGHPEERKQISLWKQFIEWEKSNPLRLQDSRLVTKRIIFAFEQCLLCLSFHVDIWYQSIQFLKEDEVSLMYERAIEATNSSLLFFAYADYEESRHKYNKVHQIYRRILENTSSDPTLAYIQYMKFARRIEGIQSAREIFKRARENAKIGFQIFIAAALMEYYCSKDKNVAYKIFELGMKIFNNNIEFISRYLEYTSHLSEENKTRSLFERVLNSDKLQPEEMLKIWNLFLKYESIVGDHTSINSVRNKRNQLMRKLYDFEGNETALLIDRYKFLNIYPCSEEDLSSFGYISTNKKYLQYQKVISYPKPNLADMAPFKPPFIIKSCEFVYPSNIQILFDLLPPPYCFRGPYVSVKSLMNWLCKLDLSNENKILKVLEFKKKK